MKCPFDLPAVKKPDFDFGKTGLYRVESANSLFLSFSLKEDEVDYIVQAINSYEKFKLVAENLTLITGLLEHPGSFVTSIDLENAKQSLQALKEQP